MKLGKIILLSLVTLFLIFINIKSKTLFAFFNHQYDLAAFSAVIAGGIMAFLWYNIPPARFYMGETGMLGLTVTLSIIAFMTKQPLLLPIIAFPLFITSWHFFCRLFFFSISNP